MYDLHVLFNSTFYYEYYRILNGYIQVNSTEINATTAQDLGALQEMEKCLKTRIIHRQIAI